MDNLWLNPVVGRKRVVKWFGLRHQTEAFVWILKQGMIIRLVPNAKALTWGCIISGTDGGRVKFRQCDHVLVRKRGGCQTRFIRRVLGWGNRRLMMKPKIIEQRNQGFLAPQYTAAQCRRRWRRALLTEVIGNYWCCCCVVSVEELRNGSHMGFVLIKKGNGVEGIWFLTWIICIYMRVSGVLKLG